MSNLTGEPLRRMRTARLVVGSALLLAAMLLYTYEGGSAAVATLAVIGVIQIILSH